MESQSRFIYLFFNMCIKKKKIMLYDDVQMDQ